MYFPKISDVFVNKLLALCVVFELKSNKDLLGTVSNEIADFKTAELEHYYFTLQACNRELLAIKNRITMRGTAKMEHLDFLSITTFFCSSLVQFGNSITKLEIYILHIPEG